MGKENDKTPSRTEHEKLFSPSQWSKRLGPDEVRQNIDIIRSYAKQSEKRLYVLDIAYINISHSKYQVIEEHIRIVTSQSNCNRIDIPARLNVPYMDRSEKLKAATKLDIFGTDLPETSPIFVYFSGGYWQVTRKLKDHLWIIEILQV